MLVRLDGIEALEVPQQRDDLVRARLMIHSSVALQKLFEQAEGEKWDPERLARSLEEGLAAHGIEIAPSICRYLADEFEARDKTKTLLVSAETGLAVAQVPEDVIYVPAPVAREGTDQLAVPLPRLQPEIEAAIILHHNAVAEEAVLTSKLEVRARSTALQRAEGDARFRITTRSGRKKLAARLREELPELMRDHQGAVGRLFQKVRINEPIPEWCHTHLPLTLRGHASILVADSLAMNLRHDPYRAARERVRSGWGRWLARAVAVLAHQVTPPTAVTPADTLPPGLLIGSPDLATAARHLQVLPVLDAPETTVAGPLFLVIRDDAYTFDAYESEASWCVDASVMVDVYVDAKSLHPWVFDELVETWLDAEVLF